MPLVCSFPPIARADGRALILGSMPGVASLHAGQYYAHRRNLFWTFMGELFGARPELDYAERTQRLLDAGIALWDVLAECERSGSLDGRIRCASEAANDVPGLLRACPQIRTVFFNGRKAETAFRRHIEAAARAVQPSLALYTLPSTSPANQTRPLQERRAAWGQVVRAVDSWSR